MTQAEFVKKAKANNYTDEQINDMLELRQQQKTETGFEMPFDKIILIEQPVY